MATATKSAESRPSSQASFRDKAVSTEKSIDTKAVRKTLRACSSPVSDLTLQRK